MILMIGSLIAYYRYKMLISLLLIHIPNLILPNMLIFYIWQCIERLFQYIRTIMVMWIMCWIFPTIIELNSKHRGDNVFMTKADII